MSMKHSIIFIRYIFVKMNYKYNILMVLEIWSGSRIHILKKNTIIILVSYYNRL